MYVSQAACCEIPTSVWYNGKGLILITMTIQPHYWIHSMNSTTLDACQIRWAGNEETSPDVCGNSWHSRQPGESWHIFGVLPKTIGWVALFYCCVEYCNYKTVSQILRENGKNNALWGGGGTSRVFSVVKVEGINLWIGSLISVLFPLHLKLLIWWSGLQASLIFCLFPPLMLIAFGFPRDSLWQNWLFCPQQF